MQDKAAGTEIVCPTVGSLTRYCRLATRGEMGMHNIARCFSVRPHSIPCPSKVAVLLAERTTKLTAVEYCTYSPR